MYYIFNPKTLHKHCKSYKTKGWAENARKRLGMDAYVTGTHEEYHAADRDVVVKNILTGQDVTIKQSEKGGPCDPSTERFHSM